MNIKKDSAGRCLQYLFQILFVILLLLICLRFKHNGIRGLVEFLEKNYFFSVIFVIALFLLKSFMLFLPVSIVCISVSFVFSPVEALTINVVGYGLSLLTGYFFGASFGRGMIDKRLEGKIKILTFVEKMGESRPSTVMLVRFLPFFPNDIMSVFFGAAKMNIKEYMIGSLIGFLPWLLVYSFVGGAFFDSQSLKITLPMAVLGFLFTAWFFAYLKRRKK